MNTVTENIDHLKLTNIAVWLIIALFIIIGYRYLKEIIGFV